MALHHIDIVLSFHLQKDGADWSKNDQATAVFVQPLRNSWKSSFRPNWPIGENFKLAPRAKFGANQPIFSSDEQLK